MCCSRGKYTFSGFLNDVFTVFFCPGINESSFSLLFLDVMIFSVPITPLRQKVTYLCVANLSAKPERSELQIPTNVPVIFFILRGPTFNLDTHFTPKIKPITFLNEQGKISPLKFEGHVNKRKTKGVRMI